MARKARGARADAVLHSLGAEVRTPLPHGDRHVDGVAAGAQAHGARAKEHERPDVGFGHPVPAERLKASLPHLLFGVRDGDVTSWPSRRVGRGAHRVETPLRCRRLACTSGSPRTARARSGGWERTWMLASSVGTKAPSIQIDRTDTKPPSSVAPSVKGSISASPNARVTIRSGLDLTTEMKTR